MTGPETPSADETTRQRFLRRLWTALNSALLITLISAVTAALLTHWFSDREAENSDLAARRAELSRDLVELELRTARLNVIQAQGGDRRAFTPADLARIGARAKAIVSADAKTVTSDPSFKDIHLVTVLGRAETAAGLNLSDKSFLLDFTDRTDDAALALTPYILCRTNQLVFYLKEHFQSGDFPLSVSDRKQRDYDSSVYSLIDGSTSCAAKAIALS
jgi:hypothetical protein